MCIREEEQKHAEDQRNQREKKPKPSAHDMDEAGAGEFDFGDQRNGKFGRSWEPFPFGKDSPKNEGGLAYAFFIRARAMYPFLSRKYM
jgi:hypothetical protein